MILHSDMCRVEVQVVAALRLSVVELPVVVLLVVLVLLALVLQVLQAPVLVQVEGIAQQEERFPMSIAHWCRYFFALRSGHQDSIQCYEQRLAGIVAVKKELYIARF